MELSLVIVLTLIFLWISWQDITEQKVLIISFIICYIACGIYFIFYQIPVTYNVYLNLAIIGLMVSVTGIYYTLRYRQKMIKQIKASVGAGDILMIPILILFFDPYGLLLFLVLSFTFCLLYWMLAKTISGRNPLIPLAGIQSFFLPILLWYEFFK